MAKKKVISLSVTGTSFTMDFGGCTFVEIFGLLKAANIEAEIQYQKHVAKAASNG